MKALSMAWTPSKAKAENAPAVIFGVGFAQLYAWGAIYYPFSVTGKLIAADLGMSLETAFAGFSLLLVTGALAAPFVGRAIDRYGGRPILSLGCLAAAASLCFAASAKGPISFFLSCAALGLSSTLALYEAAFAALIQATAGHGRRAVTFVTFFGGFASTVSWPVTSWGCSHWGWRETYLAFALGMLALNLPIYLATLRKRPARGAEPAAGDEKQYSAERQPLQGAPRRRAFTAFAVAIAAHQFVIAALLIQMIDALQLSGLGPEQAILVGMAFGPGQVLGRVAEMVWGGRFPAVAVGRVAASSLPVAMAVFLSGSMEFGLALAAALLFGMSNGLMTIARGVVPLALFGRLGYGAVVGDLGLVSLAARAGGPLALAFALEHGSLRAAEMGGLVISLLALGAMEVIVRIDRKRAR